MSKQKAQRLHARRRALERYGMEVGNGTRQQIINAIRQGRSTHVESQSHRISVHDVTLAHEELTVRVVYDKHRKEIVTFLPQECMAEAN
jgi:hypothetical protein